MNIIKRSLLVGVAALLWIPLALAHSDPPYTLYASSDLDIASCSQEGPVGKVSATFWVMRRADITGPTQIGMRDLPPDITVSFSPATLTYPGWVTGQEVTATFAVNAGIQIPDVVVQIVVSDGTNEMSSQLLLHGSCPRHNKDFTIRGFFASMQIGKIFPVEGALVEIYRDVPWQLDQRVGSTITRADGGFDVKLFADDEDTYYAKLRLNDFAGVYLHDWWTPEIKDFNSANRGSNSQPVIDLGGTLITRDGGQGTPKSAVWQGGRAAYQEYTQTFSAPPPIGDYEIVNQNTVSQFTWTARSTTNYEEGTATYKFSGGEPTAETDPGFDPYFSQFINYSTNFHEFGHALRHTVDGDQRHFTDDATRWTYARKHTLCGSASGYIDIEAFAFNEGWAEFWAMDSGDFLPWLCPSLDIADMIKEGAVMNDLHAVARSIAGCLPSVTNPTEAARANRRNLFTVLNRGSNIIHSEGEFRSNAMQQFPGCTLAPIGSSIVATQTSRTSHPLRVSQLGAGVLLRRRAEFYQDLSRRLTSELLGVDSAARRLPDCQLIPCKEFVAGLIRPIVLRGQIKYAKLIGQAFAKRLSDSLATNVRQPAFSAEVIDRERAGREEFRRSTLKIVLEVLASSAKLLDTYSGRDSTGEIVKIAVDLRRTERRLQLKAPENDEMFALIKLPPPPDDDQIRTISRSNQ